MIEADAAPGRRRVTVVTFDSVTAAVYVIHRMAAYALCRSAVVDVAAVAVDAIDVFMLSGQAITHAVVIESGLAPTLLAMAVLAFTAQRSVVHVVVCVAVRAFRQRVPMFLVQRMTVGAGSAQMRAKQREIAERMSKDSAIFRHDVCISALVIRMTDNAFASLGCVKSSVKAGRGVAVRPDILVAGNAQGCLREVRLCVMAGGAIALDVGVTLDDAARHHQFLEANGVDGGRKS